MILGCLNLGNPIAELNDTFITLIPKIKKPQSMVDFRPISLCNVVYKILSNILVNRIKHVLSSVISEAQSTFVGNHLITYNIIVASEVFRWLNLKHKGLGNKAYALKIDMSMAYDYLEWLYLQWILTHLNFSGNIVRQIMQCVSMVWFSILVNGEPSQNFVPSPGD